MLMTCATIDGASSEPPPTCAALVMLASAMKIVATAPTEAAKGGSCCSAGSLSVLFPLKLAIPNRWEGNEAILTCLLLRAWPAPNEIRSGILPFDQSSIRKPRRLPQRAEST